jgi:HAE1 family hydrophobic/amphiphilic exporter-1/multidrug efflux pump
MPPGHRHGRYLRQRLLSNGRVKKVYVQGDAPFRMQAEDLNRWYVRNSASQMVPFSAFMSSKWTYGRRCWSATTACLPSRSSVNRRGVSSGTAMAEVEKLVAQLPAGIGFEWTGSSYQERLSGNQAPMLYAISILFVFLCLAALYESWSVPFAVILAVPLGIVGPCCSPVSSACPTTCISRWAC